MNYQGFAFIYNLGNLRTYIVYNHVNYDIKYEKTSKHFIKRDNFLKMYRLTIFEMLNSFRIFGAFPCLALGAQITPPPAYF